MATSTTKQKKVISPIQAIAVFNDKKVKGTVRFTEEPSKSRVRIDVDLTGLKTSGLHGFHVHEYGDMSDSCDSMCAHFNPYNKTHGCPGMKERHVGDLGNLESNAIYSVPFPENTSIELAQFTAENVTDLFKSNNMEDLYNNINGDVYRGYKTLKYML